MQATTHEGWNVIIHVCGSDRRRYDCNEFKAGPLKKKKLSKRARNEIRSQSDEERPKINLEVIFSILSVWRKIGCTFHSFSTHQHAFQINSFILPRLPLPPRLLQQPSQPLPRWPWLPLYMATIFIWTLLLSRNSYSNSERAFVVLAYVATNFLLAIYLRSAAHAVLTKLNSNKNAKSNLTTL